jgi:catechol 2,3-dioxygenase-like lactoylglutathione lyase family enzyme
MPQSIDHIVIIADDLDAAIANAKTAGFTVVPGGTHGSGITHNALIPFRDGAYLELIAPTEQGRSAEHRWFERLRNGGGLVDFCLLCRDLTSEVAAIRARGLQYSAPFPMARVTPRGAQLAWSLSAPPGAVGQSGWPFMIEDVTPRPVRVPHEPEQLTHPNGTIGVAGISVLVRDAKQSVKDFEVILGIRARTQNSPPNGSNSGSLLFLGSTWIQIKEPGSPEEVAHLDRHGQGPYAITLRASDAPITPGAGSLIDPSLFLGARLLLA